jgi:hypothetical protein
MHSGLRTALAAAVNLFALWQALDEGAMTKEKQKDTLQQSTQ